MYIDRHHVADLSNAAGEQEGVRALGDGDVALDGVKHRKCLQQRYPLSRLSNDMNMQGQADIAQLCSPMVMVSNS